jgi:hypothetical protein
MKHLSHYTADHPIRVYSNVELSLRAIAQTFDSSLLDDNVHGPFRRDSSYSRMK